jgi:hypothetical protein
MNALPDPQREALILVGVCGFSYEETASLLGGTLGTVKSRVARARLSLLNVLQSRRLRRMKLHPASCNAFDDWLVQLDQLRISACRILESPDAEESRKLSAVPKIPLRPATGWEKTLVRPIGAGKSVADGYEALGSPQPSASETMDSVLADSQNLSYPSDDGFEEELATAD